MNDNDRLLFVNDIFNLYLPEDVYVRIMFDFLKKSQGRKKSVVKFDICEQRKTCGNE